MGFPLWLPSSLYSAVSQPLSPRWASCAIARLLTFELDVGGRGVVGTFHRTEQDPDCTRVFRRCALAPDDNIRDSISIDIVNHEGTACLVTDVSSEVEPAVVVEVAR